MLYTPEGNFTISDNFATNSFGELGLARGNLPLIIPTEVGEAGQPGGCSPRRRPTPPTRSSSTTGRARRSCQTRPRRRRTSPTTTPFRTGATGTFGADVILTQGGGGAGTYRFEPLTQVVGPANTAAPYTVEDTRTLAPDAGAIEEDGTAAVKVASFNVLNYFTTLGDADNDDDGDPNGVGGCTAFNDRAGDGNSVNSGCNQRGAWDPQDFDPPADQDRRGHQRAGRRRRGSDGDRELRGPR